MNLPDSMEKERPIPCPWLPSVDHPMSYRDLREGQAQTPQALFNSALQYAHFLWLKQLPARAILSLSRAIYLLPETLDSETRQPYQAYAWLLSNYTGEGFLGSPRISFLHQATRIPSTEPLKRARAWAMWHLTMRVLPDLPTDPAVPEDAPTPQDLADYLNQNGLTGEGQAFIDAMETRGIQ